MLDAGTRQSASDRLEVTEARMDHLPWMSDVVYPGVPFATRNPRTAPLSSVARAQTIATSAGVPLVIHVFSPFSTQPSPSRRAVVFMPAGLEPYPGSVRPKHPIASPDCSLGSHFCFCCSEPYVTIGYITSAPCTETKLR